MFGNLAVWAVAAIALSACGQVHYGRPEAPKAGAAAPALGRIAEAGGAQLLLRFKPGVRGHQMNALRTQFSLKPLGYWESKGAYVEALPPSGDLRLSLIGLLQHPWVATAEALAP